MSLSSVTVCRVFSVLIIIFVVVTMQQQQPGNEFLPGSEPPALNTTTITTISLNTATTTTNQFVHPVPDDLRVGCRELRSKRYITDGFCRSVRPVTEVVCTGVCLPMRQLPWYAEFVKVWSRVKLIEYRCVNDNVRRQRVQFHCDSGRSRVYTLRVVHTCKCKRVERTHNRQSHHLVPHHTNTTPSPLYHTTPFYHHINLNVTSPQDLTTHSENSSQH